MATDLYDKKGNEQDEKPDLFRPKPDGSHDDLGDSDSKRKTEARELEDLYKADAAERGFGDDKTRGAKQEAGSLFNQAAGGSGGLRAKVSSVLEGKINRRRAAAAGGTAGLLTIITVVFLIISGSVSVIQAGELLSSFHFSNLDNFFNDRQSNMMLHARNFAKGQRHRNNLGVVRNKLADKREAELAKRGVKPCYNTDCTPIDPDKPDSGPSGTSRSRVQSFEIDTTTTDGRKYLDDLKARYPGEFDDVLPSRKSSVRIDIRGEGSTEKARNLYDQAMRHISKDGKLGPLGSRGLQKRGLVNRFHPLRNKTYEGGQDLRDRFTTWRQDLGKKHQEGDLDTGTKDVDARDSVDTDGDKTPDAKDPVDEEVAKATNEILDEFDDIPKDDLAKKSLFKELKDKVISKLQSRAVGGPIAAVAGAVGLICLARQLYDQAEKMQYLNNIRPMMAMAMDIISAADQQKTGQDLNAEVIGFAVKLLFDDDPDVEEARKSFFNAAQVQRELGKPGGVDLDPSEKIGAITDKPWIYEKIDDIPGIQTACAVDDFVSSLTDYVPYSAEISNAVSGFTSDVLETATGRSTEDYMNSLIGFLAGEGANVFARGAELGNLANQGARYAASEMFAAAGGVQLTGTQRGELDAWSKDIDRRDFQTKPFLARVFDVKDHRSLVSKTVIQSPTVASAGSMAGSLVRTPANLFGNFASLLPTVGAQEAVEEYDYGFEEFGFTVDEITNEKYSDPYENASIVEPKLKEYNDKWGQCFGTTIDENGKIITKDAENFEGKDGDSDDGIFNPKPAKCRESSEEFTRYRFYIADSLVSASAACYENVSNEACDEIGLTATNGEAPQNQQTGNPNLYWIGDSLSIHFRAGGANDITPKLQAKGWKDICVEAEEGRPLGASELSEALANQNEPPIDCRGNAQKKEKGLEQINLSPDKEAIQKAGTVVVALGTNDGPSAFTSFRDNVIQMVDSIRTLNPQVNIIWPNLYLKKDVTNGGTYLKTDFDEMNRILAELSKEKNFKLIDWNSVAADNYGSDPIHPKSEAFANFLVEQIGSPPVSGSTLDGVECPANLEPHPTQANYYKMPEAPNGEYHIYSADRRRYGSKQLVCVLYSVGLAYDKAMGGRSKLDIGDLNAAGHKSHYKGIAVDIDAKGELAAADHTAARGGEYSTEATITLGKLFIDTGAMKNLWWCDPGDGSLDAIIKHAESLGNPLKGAKCISGHKNHFHYDIKDDYALPGRFTP